MKAKLFGRDTTVFGKSIGQFANNPEYNLEGTPKRWHKKIKDYNNEEAKEIELGEGFKNFIEAKEFSKANLIGHTIENKDTGESIYISRNSIDKTLSEKAVKQSISQDIHLKAIRILPEMLKESLLVEEHSDKNNDPNIEKLQRFIATVKDKNEKYNVKITVKMIKKEGKFNYYTYEIQEIELAEKRSLTEKGDNFKGHNPDISTSSIMKNPHYPGDPSSEKVSNDNFDGKSTTIVESKTKDTLSKSQVKSYKLFGKSINLDDKLKEGKEFPLQGELNFQGLKIAIENRKGSVRKGVDNDGEEWRTKMFYPYGYIKGSNEGVDGDKVDVYIGPNKESRKVFVIHQKDPETGKYDEDKCFLGFDDELHARDAYLAHYDDYRFLGDIVEMDIDEFKQKLKIYKGKMIKSLKSEGGRFITENELLAHRFPINSKVSLHGEIWVVKGHGKWGCYLQSEDGIRTIKGQVNYKDLELIEPLKKGKVKEYLFEKDSKPVIAIDFDGVIHKYSKGYGDGSLYDKPMEGVSEALKQLSKQYDIVIFTTRENTGIPPEMGIEKDENTVWGWLIKNKLDNYIYDITNKKPVEAKLFIDDRALEFKNWNDALDKVEDKIKKSINSSTLEEATEYEAEHEDLYQELSRRLKEDGSKMPMSEDEFFEWIATEHLGENPNYYSLLKKYVEVKKSKGNSFLGRILNLFKGTKIKDLMQLDLFGQAHAEGDSFSKDGKQYQVKRGANGAVRVHRVDSQLDLFGKKPGKVGDKPKLTLKTKTAKKNNDEQLDMFPEAKPGQNKPEQLDIFNDKSKEGNPSSAPSTEAKPSAKIDDKQSDKKSDKKEDNKNHRVFIVHKDDSPATEHTGLTKEEAEAKFNEYHKHPNSEITTWDEQTGNSYGKTHKMHINKDQEKEEPKEDVTSSTVAELYELKEPKNLDELEENVRKIAKDMASRKMAGIHLFNYLDREVPRELSKEFINVHNINNLEDVTAYINKLQVKEREGKGKERQGYLKHLQEEKTNKTVEEIEKLALEQDKAMNERIQAQEASEHHTGDTKTENGHTYQLNENHRWERVDEENNLTNPTEINNLEPTTLRGNDGQADQRGNKQPDSGTDRTSIEGGKPDAANPEQPTAPAGEGDTNQSDEGGLSNPVSSADEDSGNNGVQAKPRGMGRQQAVRSDGGTDTGTSTDKLVSDSAKPNNGNYELRDKAPVELTKGQRRAINDKVKEIIASGKKSNELTDEEKDTLRQYTGEGGLSSGTSEALTQHYTGYQLINRMFEALNEAGVKYKNVLEPAVGSGNFIGHAPGAKWTAVDIDKTNTEVAKLLYPEAKIYNTPYQEFKGKGFDLIISNVPFLEKMPGEKHSLHDFYFIHSLDLAKDNGVVAFVTSKGTMDKLDSAARKEMIEKGDVLGCFRLPSSTFEKNAHTSVVTDVIFMQKRPGKIPAELSKHKAENELFLESGKTNDEIPLSKYYQAHPENILGDMQVGKNKLYGGVDYHITGEADLSKISLPQIDNYPTQNNDDNVKIRSSVDFENHAVANNIRYRSSNNPGYFQNVEYDARKNELWVKDGDHSFDDTAMKIKTYKKVEDDELKGKIRILDKLKQLADLKQDGVSISTDDVTDLIQIYQQNYKHPANDKEFKRFFKSNDEMKYFQDLSSYFDEDFNPKEVFSAQTRYSGSGTIEINEDSPLIDRAFASEDLQGVIDLENSQYLKPSDFKELVKAGYNIVGPNKLQNNALYYSGNIYAKIDNVKKLIENKVGDKEVLDKQLKNLTNIIPEEREIGDISFKGNEKWMEQFRSELGIYVRERDGKNIYEFSMRGVSWDEREIYNKYLNSQPLAELFNTVRDPITGNDKKVPKPEAEQKQLIAEANEKLEKAKQAIRDKVMADPILAGQIQSAFNRQYNNYVKPDYNTIIETTLEPFLQELPEGFSLRANQLNWVAKALYEGKGINAQDVGSGKTLSAIFLARVLKAKGIAKKPLFMVPAKTIRKWEREIKMIYPDANIVNLGNLTKDKRNEALFNVSNQNADYVLITHEGFEKIKLPKEKEMEYFRQIVDESMFDEEKKGRAAALQDKRISEFEKVLKEQPVDPRLTFDKLGFDALICDEAHNFKNIGVSSKLTKWGAGKAFTMKAGNDGDVKLDSARSYDLRFKATYINEKNNGKNVFLLTATPTPNKPMELFTMLRHLDPDLLSREYNIRTDRDFASMFFTYAQVQNPERPKGHDNIITSITHGIALRKILDRFVDKLPMQKMNWIKVPESEVVKHYMQPSDSITSIMKDIQERTGNLKSKVQKGDDTLVAIYATGRNAAIDPRLYNSEHARVKIHSRTGDVKTDKIERCIKTVAEVHKEDKEANQLIFLDNSGIQTGVDIHGEIKRELARKGFKENEIAIISGDKITNPATGKDIKATGDKLNTLKQQVADDFNAGKIKVIIGTTKSMGEGMDLQVKTTDIHHLDIPYTPAEIIQRRGRGVRPGNVNEKVREHVYIQGGTFDNLSYSIVSNKTGWNEAMWDKAAADVIDTSADMAGAMPSEDEIRIELERDPVKKQKLIVDLRRKKLASGLLDTRQLHRRAESELKIKQDALKAMPDQLKEAEANKEKIKSFQADLKEIIKDREKYYDIARKYNWGSTAPVKVDWSDSAMEYNLDKVKDAMKDVNWRIDYFKHSIERLPESIAKLQTKYNKTKATADQVEQEVLDFVKRYKMGKDTRDIYNDITLPKEEKDEAIRRFNEEQDMYKSIVIAKIFGKPSVIFKERPKLPGSRRIIKVFGKSL